MKYLKVVKMLKTNNLKHKSREIPLIIFSSYQLLNKFLIRC